MHRRSKKGGRRPVKDYRHENDKKTAIPEDPEGSQAGIRENKLKNVGESRGDLRLYAQQTK
jgi:hypothetical protein